MKHILPLLLLSIPLGGYAQQSGNTAFSIGKNLKLFADIYRQLDAYYVDTLSADTAMRWAIDGMLQEIDPYTAFYPADDDELTSMTSGRYGGIGALIRFFKREDRCMIEELYEGCPAQMAGVKAGDVIVSIDGRDIKGQSTGEVTKQLRGEAGSTFELRVQRTGHDEPLSIIITRQQIQTPAVPWYGVVDEDSHTGYLYLSSFTEGCAREVRHAFIQMRQEGMQRFILDLRDNPGGSVSEAVQIVGLFVPKGSPVVSTKGKLPSTCYDYLSPSEPLDSVMPMAVMVNSNSASASEIVSGALQDLDRAVIIGQRTYGKGIVQSLHEVNDGGSLKITTAHYYLPSGRCIQSFDYRRRASDGAAVTLPDSLTHVLYTRLGRPVRDGGGVLPDSVLPVDSLPTFVYDLMASDVVLEYVNDYTASHPTIAPAGQFHLTDADYEEFCSAVIASDFKSGGRTLAALTQLRRLAQFEGLLEQTTSQFDALEEQLKVSDVPSYLARFKSLIMPSLETDIAGRYYYIKGSLQQQLASDKTLKRAIAIIN
ncbi:MAG: S41 family peptidase [Bacteroidaceae bacterium]|nr:S41 family peptidase [Bacteroidaceae bacterium]